MSFREEIAPGSAIDTVNRVCQESHEAVSALSFC